MKKFVAILLALSLVMSFAVAFAVEGAEGAEEIVPVEETAAESGEGTEDTAADVAEPVEGEEEAVEEEVVEEEVVEEEVVEPNELPAEDVEIVAGADASTVIINGIEYVYVCFTEQAKNIAGGAPIFWGRIYGNDAYLFSMTTGKFLGKFNVADLSYVDFVAESYMSIPNIHSIPLVKEV